MTSTIVTAFDQVAQRIRARKPSQDEHEFNETDEQSAAASATVPFPKPMAAAAYHGLAGMFVHSVEKDTEACPEVLLVSFLAAFGSAVGRGPFFRIEDDEHGVNLFVAIVGKSAKGRKGTSWRRVRKVFAAADPKWAADRVVSGLRSGEALIDAVRDQRVKLNGKGEPELLDEGVADKRLLVLEEELASVLRLMQREGSTISPVVRQAWDRADLRNLSKGSPARATGASISILGHITQAELRRSLDRTELANGFANRFLFCAAYRARKLADGGAPIDATRWGELIAEALRKAQQVGEVVRDAQARALWHQIYEDLSADRPGLLGEVTSRAEAQVTRLALLFALIDGVSTIAEAHLRAALEIWRYCRDSAAWIFGTSLGDPVADAILAALASAEEGLTRTQISAALGRNRSQAEISRALELLRESGLARAISVRTEGRPRELWQVTSLNSSVSSSYQETGTNGDHQSPALSAEALADPAEVTIRGELE